MFVCVFVCLFVERKMDWFVFYFMILPNCEYHGTVILTTVMVSMLKLWDGLKKCNTVLLIALTSLL